MTRIIGRLYNHDDSTTDRSVGSKLFNADRETRENWKNFYNETFPLFGAMHRGNPPAGILYKINPKETHSFSTKRSDITLEKLTLNFRAPDPERFKKVKLAVSSASNQRIVKEWFSLKGPRKGKVHADTISWTMKDHYTLDTKVSNGVHFGLKEYVGWAFFRSKVDIGQGYLNLLSQVEFSDFTNNGGQINAQVPIGADISVDIQGHFSAPQRGETLLFLDKGNYQTAVIPENVQQLWGPVTLERVPQGTDNRCQVAEHRLQNHIGNVEFTTRTIHIQPLMMSVVQVFYHDKMSAIGHLIASDQLPLPTQVSRDGITLNPRQGERAVLIKNNGGDWGIVTGRWKGFKRGVASTSSNRGVVGSPGMLFVKFYKFSTNKTTTAELGYLDKNYNLKIDSSRIDLMKGVLNIDSTNNEVAENIALAFSVSLLHVLCVPRPKGWKQGQQVKTSVTSRGSREITVIPSDDMAFIMAAGLLRETPSNYYMNTYFGARICAMCGGGGCGGAIEIDGGDFEALPGGDADGGDTGCDGSACGGDGDGGGCGGGCGGCGGCGGDGGGCGGDGGCGGGCGGCGGD